MGTTNNVLRWGILSTASITEAGVFAMHSAPRSVLSAVASRDFGKAQDFAKKNNIEKAYGSYEELINDRSIDAVYIPLPNALHAEWALRAIDEGKNVLIEKPMVLNLSDLDLIESAAEKKHVTVFEAFMSLHAPQNIMLRDLLEKGKIGKLQVTNEWFMYNLSPEETSNIRLNPALGGGAYLDIGVYENSYAIAMSGGKAPKSVWAVKEVGETGVDVGFSALMEFENGVTSQFYAGLRSPFMECAQFIGSEGIIRINNTVMPGMETRSIPGKESFIEISDHSGKTETIVVPPSNPWQKEIEAMECCVLDGAKPVVPLSLSREFLKSSVALLKSADIGEKINL